MKNNKFERAHRESDVTCIEEYCINKCEYYLIKKIKGINLILGLCKKHTKEYLKGDSKSLKDFQLKFEKKAK